MSNDKKTYYVINLEGKRVPFQAEPDPMNEERGIADVDNDNYIAY